MTGCSGVPSAEDHTCQATSWLSFSQSSFRLPDNRFSNHRLGNQDYPCSSAISQARMHHCIRLKYDIDSEHGRR